MIRLRAAGTCIALAVALAATFNAPALATDNKQTLRVSMAIAETSFDPAFASDAASDSIIENVFESMLTYDYLARPVKLVPRTLEAMPLIEDKGSTYTFKLRKGIVFTPDPAFKGKRRELVAEDYAYSVKRILDPAVKSPWAWMFEGKLVGGDEAHANAVKTGKFDYDKPFARPRGRRSPHAAYPVEEPRLPLPLRRGGAQHRSHGARSRRGLRYRYRRASRRHRPLQTR